MIDTMTSDSGDIGEDKNMADEQMDERVQSQAAFSSSYVSETTKIDSDEDGEEVISYQQKHRNRRILQDSDEESSSQNGPIQSSCSTLPKDLAVDIHHSEIEEKESLNDDHSVRPETDHLESSASHNPASDRPIQLSMLNNDVFDAEQDSDGDVAADAANSGLEDAADDESNEGEMSTALKRRLAKGASKKAKPGRAGGHPKHDNVNEIHRETQRIVRESSLRLPYHKPPKLDLSVFLSRTEQKRLQLASISTTAKLRLRPILKDVEAVNNIISTTRTQKKEKLVPSTNEFNNVKTDVSSQLSDLPSADIENSETGRAKLTAETPVLPVETVSSCLLFLDEDELPDLIVETEEKNSRRDVLECRSSPDGEDALRDCSRSDDLVENVELAESVSEKIINLNIASQMTACTSLINSWSSTNGSLNAEPTGTNSQTSLTDVGTGKENVSIQMQATGAPTSSNSMPTTAETAKYSECGSRSVTSHTSTFESSVVSDGIVPCVSKPMLSSDTFIDLDEESEGDHKLEGEHRLEIGITNLMARMCKHSCTPIVKKPKHIEITTVSKETVDDGKQELKLEKLVYSSGDVDDKPTDPFLNTPGAKLTLLREKLRASMKVKREESMQKRYEMFEQEYGGSYKEQRMEEEAKEEAELTDQTDTDDEEGEEEEEEEEEIEEDEEERAVKRNSNPFVTEEADDDDDDEEDEDYNSNYEGDEEADDASDKADDDDDEESAADQCNMDDLLNLHLDTEDVDDGNTADSNCRASSSDRRSLKKMKTMDLFDEDANTEAEGMSQKSNTAETEFEKRAFEEVSSACLSRTKCSERDNLGYSSGIRLLDPMEADQTDDITMSSTSQLRDSSMASADSSFDMLGSLIPAGQRSRPPVAASQMLRVSATPEPCTPMGRSVMSASSDQLSSRALVSEEEILVSNSTPVAGKSTSSPDGDIFLDDDFHLRLEDESQIHRIDEKWELEGMVGTQPRRHLVMGEGTLPFHGASSIEGTSQDNNMDELLGLCSGNFSSLAASRESNSMFNPVSTVTQSDSNMDELLGLCSGQFTSLSSPHRAGNADSRTGSQTAPSSIGQSNFASNGIFRDGTLSSDFTFDDSPIKKKSTRKRRAAISDDEDDDEVKDKNNDSFEAASLGDDDQKMSEDEVFSDADDDRDSESEKQKLFKGFVVKGKHGKIRKEFVEDEAELSGSEFESDEDLDLDEKDDFLEQEAGDQDDIGTEEELRDQVHRVHLKTMIDQDAREIRLLQEQYLPDGDLQSDGAGRMRRFRWKNADDDQNDLQRNFDDEQAEEEGENEARWRTERLEREKFLEQREGMESAGQASRLLKLGSVIFHRKSDMSTPSPVLLTPKTPLSGENVKVPVGLFKVPGQGHGSFLSRSKGALANLGEMTKASTKANPTRNSRNFVFSTISSPEHKEKMAVQVNHATPASARPPPKKRPCPERRNSLPQNSIFMLFDKAKAG